MKHLKNLMLCSMAFLAMSVTACGGGGNGGSSEPPVDENEVSVFLLSGQSNMEGNSKIANLEQAFTDLGFDDYAEVSKGFSSVQISTYLGGYGGLNKDNLTNNGQVYATNTENQIAGKFVDMKPGFGTNSSSMGPEFGAAYYLKDYATEDKPIFFVKMASNGSGFAQSGTDYNWPVKDAEGNFPEVNLYHTFAKPFLKNNLQLIEDMGYKPVVKAWLWHQGESDCDPNKIPLYAQRLNDMVSLFREDFADYARDEDGDNIAFIDGMVYQGTDPKSSWTTPDLMNAEKQKFADSGDNNFIVDTYGNAEEKNNDTELKPGNPGGDSMHYNTKSSLRLGMAYGKVIVDNDLLD